MEFVLAKAKETGNPLDIAFARYMAAMLAVLMRDAAEGAFAWQRKRLSFPTSLIFRSSQRFRAWLWVEHWPTSAIRLRGARG